MRNSNQLRRLSLSEPCQTSPRLRDATPGRAPLIYSKCGKVGLFRRKCPVPEVRRRTRNRQILPLGMIVSHSVTLKPLRRRVVLSHHPETLMSLAAIEWKVIRRSLPRCQGSTSAPPERLFVYCPLGTQPEEGKAGALYDARMFIHLILRGQQRGRYRS